MFVTVSPNNKQNIAYKSYNVNNCEMFCRARHETWRCSKSKLTQLCCIVLCSSLRWSSPNLCSVYWYIVQIDPLLEPSWWSFSVLYTLSIKSSLQPIFSSINFFTCRTFFKIRQSLLQLQNTKFEYLPVGVLYCAVWDDFLNRIVEWITMMRWSPYNP